MTETKASTSGVTLSTGVGSPTQSLIHTKADKTSTKTGTLAENLNPFIKEVDELTDYVSGLEAHPPKEMDVSQLRHLVGKLSLYDLQALKSMLNDANIVALIKDRWKPIALLLNSLDGSGEEKPIRMPIPKQKRDRAELRTLDKILVENEEVKQQALVYGVAAFFKTLDIPIIGNLRDDEGRLFWFTLNKQFLAHVNGELIFKYKGEVPGFWSIACIIDEVPVEEPSTPLNAFDEFLTEFHAIKRNIFEVDYLISPLIVYRNLDVG